MNGKEKVIKEIIESGHFCPHEFDMKGYDFDCDKLEKRGKQRDKICKDCWTLALGRNYEK